MQEALVSILLVNGTVEKLAETLVIHIDIKPNINGKT